MALCDPKLAFKTHLQRSLIPTNFRHSPIEEFTRLALVKLPHIFLPTKTLSLMSKIHCGRLLCTQELSRRGPKYSFLRCTCYVAGERACIKYSTVCFKKIHENIRALNLLRETYWPVAFQIRTSLFLFKT